MKHGFLPWFVLFVLLIALGCGGGGGGGPATPTTVNLVGNVVWIETGLGTSPAATVRSGDVSTSSDVSDGLFSLDVPSGATSVTVTYTPTGGTPIVQTFTFAAATSDTDLGELFIGPTTVSVTGRVLDSSNGSPVAAAKVTLAGRQAVSGADGKFSVTGVAYSNSVQSIFHALQGSVSKTGYFSQFFAPTGTAVGGKVDVGDLSMSPQGTNDTPPPPGNVTVNVSPGGGGATVQALVGTTVIRTATADGNGVTTLWLPAGSYTIKATLGSKVGTNPLTLATSNQLATVNVTLP